MSVIEVEGLRKTYRSRSWPKGRTIAALDDVSVSVPQGCVFGIVGPNGSGKTTLIHCLLGLSRANSGTVRLLGATVPTDLDRVMDRVGAMLELPNAFSSFTGRRWLELLAASRGVGSERVATALEDLGMAERADDRIATYSLGMRQRIGVAGALVKNAEVFVLDEPANGLDPEGRMQVRSLLRALGDQGKTVVVSSHILSEVEEICDRVALLANGRCLVEATVAELVAHLGVSARVVVGIPRLEDGLAALQVAGFEAVIERESLVVNVRIGEEGSVSEALAASGQFVTELRRHGHDLEQAYLRLIGDSPGEGIEEMR